MSKQSHPLLTLTDVAGATLSANRFITFDGTVPSSGAAAFGVVRSAASAGDSIAVDVAGTVVVETGGVFSAGVELQCDSSGRVVTASGGTVLGVALQASTGSGQFVEVLLRNSLGTKFGYVLTHNDVTEVSANGALPISGVSLIAVGTGLASLTLAAPQPGCMARIRAVSRTSGNAVVTTAAGVTFDGTNNTATFDAVGDELVLGYKSATQWVVIQNTSTALSSV